jgi:hypothetical protein
MTDPRRESRHSLEETRLVRPRAIADVRILPDHPLMKQSMIRALARSALSILAAAVLAGAAHAEIRLPPFPQDLDLSPVERLYKSAAYRVEVKEKGAPDSAFRGTFVFETRNDWTLFDYFNPDPARHRDIIAPADAVGIPQGKGGGTGKTDMRTASFAQMSFSQTPVEVRVTLLAPGATIADAKIRPLRLSVTPRIDKARRSLTFTLDRPRKVSVEINGRLDPLFIFADAPDVPDPEATYYFGPGLHRIPGNGTLTLKSGERVYVAAGAIVEGRFHLEAGSSGITIRGRGILSGGEWPELKVDPAWQARYAAIHTQGSHDFRLEGLTLVQSTTWQVAMDDYSATGDATHHNDYRNIKMVSWNGCTDGIWITGDDNRVDDVFIFNNDDFFVTKGGRNTHVSNAVVWGGGWGRFFLFHNILPNTPSVENLTVENVDMIGKEGAKAMFLFENYESPSRRASKTTKNVTFRNIVFEERRRPGNSNNTAYNAARFIELDTDLVPGAVSGLTFENIDLDQILPDEGEMLGTAASPIDGVTFRNVTVRGRKIRSFDDLNIRTNQHVRNVRVLD